MQVTLPKYVYIDLSEFISTYYSKHLTHPLLIAQEFCLRFQEHGKKFNISTIAEAAEDIINDNHY